MIMFLDIDGVLHPENHDAKDFSRNPYLWLVLRACPDLGVVFSSSWREMYSLDRLVQLVTNGGGEELQSRFVGVNPIIEPTQKLTDYRFRELECLSWLAQNSHQATPWLALDDNPYLFSTSSPNLYLTDSRVGLTTADVAKIIMKLNASHALQNPMSPVFMNERD